VLHFKQAVKAVAPVSGCNPHHNQGAPVRGPHGQVFVRGWRSLAFGDREGMRQTSIVFRTGGHSIFALPGPQRAILARWVVTTGPRKRHLLLRVIMNYNVIHGRYTMPANSLVQTRINAEIKEEAATVLRAIGLTVSDAVRLMLTRVAREKALHSSIDSQRRDHRGNERGSGKKTRNGDSG